MKVEELRLKNLVSYPGWHKNGEDKIWHVRDLYFEGDEINLTDGRLQTKVDFASIAPIPLTEEWLVKFGFGINITGNAMWCDPDDFFQIGVYPDGYWYGEWENTNDDPYVRKMVKIQYVHQLQNLYFALTQKELTI